MIYINRAKSTKLTHPIPPTVRTLNIYADSAGHIFGGYNQDQWTMSNRGYVANLYSNFLFRFVFATDIISSCKPTFYLCTH